MHFVVLVLSGISSLLCPLLALPQASGNHTELELGITSYKAGQYEEAIQHFQKAVSADPNNINAHMYLATAYGQQYFPGDNSIDNVRIGELAFEQYQKVLEIDDRHVNAIKGAAYLELMMKKFQAAKKLYQRASEADPTTQKPFTPSV